MGSNTNIEWCDHTFNPWIGCTKVSPGCAHCYAETQDKFRGWTPEGWGKGKPRRRTSAANWKQPERWDRDALEAIEEGVLLDKNIRRPRVFCASLADWLDVEVPIEWLADLLDLIRRTPNLDWLLLTKRPENWAARIRAARNYLTKGDFQAALWLNDWLPKGESAGMPARDGKPPANVWIGTTAEDQQRADERIPHLLKIPAKVRFLSCEPLLGDVRLPFKNKDREPKPDGFIHWVICGGESGPEARPMHPDWARSLRDQCQAAGVPFFMKQMGGVRKPFAEIPADLLNRQFPEVRHV